MGLDDFLRQLALLESDSLELTFLGGRNPDCDWDGSHFALPGHLNRPLSISRVEARYLANLVSLLDCTTVLEIGMGFGYSTAWLARGLSLCSVPRTVYTVDDFSEGELGRQGLKIAEQIWTALDVRELVTVLEGSSPTVIAERVRTAVDLVFIDGEHHGEQPLIDYRAARDVLSPLGCLVFHDVQPKYDVQAAIDEAEGDGFACTYLGTSCNMVAAARSDDVQHAIRSALDLSKRGLLMGASWR